MPAGCFDASARLSLALLQATAPRVRDDDTGFVRIDERGILITLARSKASQDKAETVVIPRADLPEACEALDAWAKRAALQPGEPIFRAVNNRHQIAAERLMAHSVSRIVKKAMRDLARRRGKPWQRPWVSTTQRPTSAYVYERNLRVIAGVLTTPGNHSKLWLFELTGACLDYHAEFLASAQLRPKVTVEAFVREMIWLARTVLHDNPDKDGSADYLKAVRKARRVK